MKKSLLCLALFALLALPVLAGAETWAAFVERAEAAMAEADTLCLLEVEGIVEGYLHEYTWSEQDRAYRLEPLDRPLIVPEGMGLILWGGYSEGMYLGGGQVELVDMTVVSRRSGRPAILLAGPEAPLDIGLSIDNRCLVRALSKETPAIGRVERIPEAGRDAPVSVYIENYGFVEGGVDGCGISLAYGNPGMGKVELQVTNYGGIRGGVRLDAASQGDAEAALTNIKYAAIEGGCAFLAATADGVAAVSVENQAEARIAAPEGAAFSLQVNPSTAYKETPAGRIEIRNDGLLEGDVLVSLTAPLSENIRLDWADAGLGAGREAALRLDMRGKGSWLGEGVLQEKVLDWLRAQALPELPPETPGQIAQWPYPLDMDCWEILDEGYDFTWGELGEKQPRGFERVFRGD